MRGNMAAKRKPREPFQEMKAGPDDTHVAARSALLWRFLTLIVRRYGSVPAGQALVAYTLAVAHELGVQLSINDLITVSDLPRSTVSRYVASMIDAGNVEEAIDPADRRRRLLRATSQGVQESRRFFKWYGEMTESVLEYERAGRFPDPDAFRANIREAVNDFPPRHENYVDDF